MGALLNWKAFSFKFDGREQEAFEALAYVLFCRKYDQKEGIPRRFNQWYIETDPIQVGADLIGFQAKHYTSPTVDDSQKRKLLNTVKDVHNKYPDLNVLWFYLANEFSDSKGVNPPKRQGEIEAEAAACGIRIEWVFPSNLEIILNRNDMFRVKDFFFSERNWAAEVEYGPQRFWAAVDELTSSDINGSCGAKTANQQYVNMFVEPLFLHRDEKDTRVKLENLFVFQDFSVHVRQNEYSDTAMKDMRELFCEFISSADKEVLFVEGDAGSGKTSLMAWLNYIYSKGEEIGEKTFQGRPLITVRLRDLNREEILKNRLVSAVLLYLNLSTLDDLEHVFPRAIMILDGFDELCMLEGDGRDNNSFLEDMFRRSLKDYKFIVTSRPKYLNENVIKMGDFVFIHHFDVKKREEWLEHYTSDKYCGAQIDENIYSYICTIDDSSSSCILDTPMTLYMLAAKKGAEKYLDNSWALYRHIFHEVLSETEYNKMIPDPNRNYAHEVHNLREALYQISEELAYHMYQEGNHRFYLTEETLSDIIENLSKENHCLQDLKIREIARHCYALCCYWKANTEKGAVEFLHNNIRDFFLAEKILRELDKLVNKSNKEFAAVAIPKLAKLFRHGILETKVTEFIYLRTLYNKEHRQSDFGLYEYEHKSMPAIIRGLAGTDIMTDSILDKELELPPIEIVTNIVTAAAQTFRYLYEPYLSDEGMIPWNDVLTEKNSFITLFRQVFSKVPITLTEENMISMGSKGNYSGIVFAGRDLRNIDFQKSDLSHADFSDTILCGSDFENADMRGVKFNNADAHFASLKMANLSNCDMTGCDLRGTDLPDGFASMDQDKQVEHLKSLNIEGLVI